MGYDRMVLNVLTFSIENFEVNERGLRGTLMFSEGILRNYIEFNRPISVITGKTGCGKTMLGVALYSVPVYIASLVFDVKEFVYLIDISLGEYFPLRSMLINSTIELCRPSVEIPELKESWSLDVIRRVCIRSKREYVQLTLHKTDGKLEVLDVRKNLDVAYRILLQAAMTLSRPSHFISTQYMLNDASIRYIVSSAMQAIGTLKHREVNLKQKDMIVEIARLIVATRIPPIILAKVRSVQELLDIPPPKGPVYHSPVYHIKIKDVEKLYLPYSLGELKFETLAYDLELLRLLHDEVKKKYDTNIVSYMYIDDIFDGFDLKNSLRVSQYFIDVIDVLEERGVDAKFILSTHRIESLAPFLERYAGGGTLEYYVATYDLPEIASKVGVTSDFKIALVPYASLSEDLRQVYDDHFIRIQVRTKT
jgi:uncharacterized protein YfbU (UPF0304 family)